MKSVGPARLILTPLFLICIMFIASNPVPDPITSMAELKEIASKLNYQFVPGQVPLIVFTRPGCGACPALVSRLQAKGCTVFEQDITRTNEAAQVHRRLGKNYLGTTATLVTPTTIVGLKVIRGSRTDAILQALDEQRSSFR